MDEVEKVAEAEAVGLGVVGCCCVNRFFTKSSAKRVKIRQGSSIRIPFLAEVKASSKVNSIFCDFNTT